MTPVLMHGDVRIWSSIAVLLRVSPALRVWTRGWFSEFGEVRRALLEGRLLLLQRLRVSEASPAKPTVSLRSAWRGPLRRPASEPLGQAQRCRAWCGSAACAQRRLAIRSAASGDQSDCSARPRKKVRRTSSSAARPSLPRRGEAQGSGLRRQGKVHEREPAVWSRPRRRARSGAARRRRDPTARAPRRGHDRLGGRADSRKMKFSTGEPSVSGRTEDPL